MNQEVIDYLKSVCSATPDQSHTGQWNFKIGSGGIALPANFFNKMDLPRIKEVLTELMVKLPDESSEATN